MLSVIVFHQTENEGNELAAAEVSNLRFSSNCAKLRRGPLRDSKGFEGLRWPRPQLRCISGPMKKAPVKESCSLTFFYRSDCCHTCSFQGLKRPQKHKGTTSTPQLPFKIPHIPSNRDHKAINRGTLGGLGTEPIFLVSPCIGPSLEPEREILMFMWSFGPLASECH